MTRQIFHALGTPSNNNLKMIVTTNATKNLPVTLDDIKTAKINFGQDIGML